MLLPLKNLSMKAFFPLALLKGCFGLQLAAPFLSSCLVSLASDSPSGRRATKTFTFSFLWLVYDFQFRTIFAEGRVPKNRFA